MRSTSFARSEPFDHPRRVSTCADQERDVIVLRGVARGERAALGELYDSYASAMLALGLRILRSRREVEDLLHDVFIEVWRHAGDYDPERASVRSWLLLRMRSRCLDRLRSHAYSRTDSLSGQIESDAERHAEAVGRTELAFDAGRLVALLGDLPEAQREVLELGYFRGLSFQEIADCLGIPLGTVKSRVSAAMIRLRNDLGVARGGSAA